MVQLMIIDKLYYWWHQSISFDLVSSDSWYRIKQKNI